MITNIFDFVDLLQYNYRKNKKSLTKEKGSLAIEEPIDISKYQVGDWIGHIPNIHNELIDIFCEKGNYRLQFGKENYKRFRIFVSNLITQKGIKDIITFDDLESEIFKWLVNIKEDLRSTTSFETFLSNLLQENMENRIFFFPIDNIHIEKKFTIGEVDFSYFDDSFFESLKNTNPENWKIHEKNLKNDFRGKVYASVRSSGIKEMIELKAKEKVEIAVDILKIYGPTLIHAADYNSFDLSYRLNFQQFANSLSLEDNSFNFTMHVERHRPPTIFNVAYINEINSELKLFSYFVSKYNTSEIERIIIQAIKLYANSLSFSNIYARITQIFMILESIFMEDDKKNKTEKIIARVPKLLTTKFEEKLEIKNILKEFYQIRHNYIHKAIRKDIDYKNLNTLQEIVLNTIIRLIEHKHFKTKENLLIAINKEKA